MFRVLFCSFFPGFAAFQPLAAVLFLPGNTPAPWDTAIAEVSVGEERGHDIVVDETNGFVYVCGAFNDGGIFPTITPANMNAGTNGGKYDGFLVQYDLKGNFNWAVHIGGDQNDECTGVALDSAGNVFVSGYFQGIATLSSISSPVSTLMPAGTSDDIFVASWDKTGIYIAGVYEKIASFGPINTESTYNGVSNGFLAKYDSSGNEQWMVEMKSDDDDYDENELIGDLAYAVTATEQNIFVIGYMGGTNMRFTNTSGSLLPVPILFNGDGSENVFMTCHDANGNLNWAQQIENNSATIRGFGIAHDCDGLYITGTLHDGSTLPGSIMVLTGDHDNPFLVSLDPATGLTNWARVWPSNVNHEDIACDVAADGYGNLFLTGRFMTSPFLTPDTSLSPASDMETFVAKYKNTGTFQWAHLIPGNGDVMGHAIATHTNDFVYVTGEFNLSVNVGPFALSGNASPNLYLGRLAVNSSGTKLTNCCKVPANGGSITSSKDSLCNGDSAIVKLTGYSGLISWEVSGDGGVSWATIPGLTADTIIVNPNGAAWYRAVLSSTGCADITSTAVYIVASPVPTQADAGPAQLICNNTSSVFDGNDAKPGIGTWSLVSGTGLILNPNDSNSAVTGLSQYSNLFEWKIESGVCPVSRDTVNLISIPAPNVNLGNDTTICQGDTLILDAGNPNHNYLWSSGASSQKFTATSPGIFWVDVDTAGCKSRDSISLSLLSNPVLNLGSDSNLCAGDSLTLTAWNAGSTYVWSTGDTTSSVVVFTQATYHVLVTSGGICMAADTIQISVVSVPVVNLGSDSTLCEGDNMALNAGNPGSAHLWSTGDSNQTIVVVTSGAYHVQNSAGGTCLSSDTISLVFSPAPFILASGLDSVYCESDADVSLGSIPSAGIFSGPGISNTTFSPSAAGPGGPYSIVFSFADSIGCSSDTSMITRVDSMPPPANAGPDQTLYRDSGVQMNAAPIPGFPTSWVTLEGSGNFADPDSPTSQLSGLSTGTNTFIWEAEGGICGSSEDTVHIYLLSINIPEGISPNGDGANDVFEIPGWEPVHGTGISVFTRWGQEVYRAFPYSNNWDGSNNMGEPLTDDTYYVLVKMEDEKEYGGFVVIRR